MPMSMRVFDRLMLSVHAVDAPTNEEWREWLDLCRTRHGLEARVLVENHSSGPNVLQRKALGEVVRGEDARCAVLTDSTIERAALTAIAWLGISLRGFTLDQHKQAASYLELSEQELTLALSILPSMRKECGLQFARAAGS
jgi:hypothetical protein